MIKPFWKTSSTFLTVAFLLGLLAVFFVSPAFAQSSSFILVDASELSTPRATPARDSLLESALSPLQQQGLQFPHGEQALTQIMQRIRLEGKKKPPLLVMYGASAPDMTSQSLVKSLLKEEWPLILVNHPQARLSEKAAWDAWLLSLKHQFQAQMNDQLGQPEESVLDKALAG